MSSSKIHRSLMAWSVALVTFCLLSGPAWAGEEPVDVAVLNMEGRGVEADLLQTLTGVLRNEAQQHRQYAVVNPAPISLSEIVVVLGCSPEATSCLRQVAEYIEARVLIHGQVDRRGGKYEFSVEIFDAPTGRVIHQISRGIGGADDPVVVFRREIESFFGAQTGPALSRVQIGSTVDAAQIRIEGILVGTTPFERMGLDAGRYDVEVSAPGYEPWRITIDVVEGGDVRLWAPLIEKVGDGAAQPVVKSEPAEPARVVPTDSSEVPEIAARPNNWGAWGAVGVGVLALGGSAFMVVKIRDTEREIETLIGDAEGANPRYDELVSRGRSYEMAHRVLLGVGGVSFTAGVLWLVLNRRQDQGELGLQWHLGPNQVGASWRF